MKDPGFAVDLTLRGNIRDYVDVYLGHRKWRDVAGARSGAGKHGGKPRKIGEGRATRSGERPGVSSSHLGAFAKPSRNANVTNSRRSEIEV